MTRESNVEIDLKEVGRRIAHARKFAGLRQADLAAEVGLVTRAIQNFEGGVRMPWKHLDRIASATGRSKAWLVHGDVTSVSGAVADDLSAILRRLESIERAVKEVREVLDRRDFEHVFRGVAERS